MILNPTRITQNTATLIDNVFTNNTDNILKSGILVNDVSDHLSAFTIVNYKKCNSSPPKYYKRLINDTKISEFNSLLESFNWYDVYECNDVDGRFNIFMEKVSVAYNQCFPIKEVSPKKIRCQSMVNK